MSDHRTAVSGSDSNKKNVFQVIGNYEAVETGKNEYLAANQGDLIVDCEPVDENWFRGKCVRSGVYGLIPKANIVSVTSQHEYREIEPEQLCGGGNKTPREQEEESAHDATYDEADDENRSLIKDKKTPVKQPTSSPSSTTKLSSRKKSNKKPSQLSRLGEGSYVDMSSEETLNCIDEEENIYGEIDDEYSSLEITPLRNGKEEKALGLPKRSPIPKPPRHPSVSGGTNDEGYNSASHYSGENPDVNGHPLLNAGGGQPLIDEDEAGYEVPKINPAYPQDHDDEVDDSPTKAVLRKKKKKKSLMMLWKGRGSETESKLQHNNTNNDEARENYYDPPADIRDNYFLPFTRKPTTRVVLSLILSLGISLALFLVLLLVVGLHAVLCFSISCVVFIVFFVVPVTLYHRGILCVTLLVLPSLVGRRSKLVLFVLLTVFLIMGPVFGTSDKINVANTCAHNRNGDDGGFYVNVTIGSLADNCLHAFRNVNIFSEKFCSTRYASFIKACDTWASPPMNELEKASCNQTEKYFCRDYQRDPRKICMVARKVRGQANLPSDLRRTRVFKLIFFYLLPFLFLLVLVEAYNYNKVYLTTKNTDNIYITQRLRELDTERRDRGLTDLILPLTRIELYTYLVRGNWATTKYERRRIFCWLKLLLVFVFITIVMVLIEDAVDGVLLMTLSTSPCSSQYLKYNQTQHRVVIYALLGAVFFVILIQSHVLRMRSVICDYIYPEMIETRSKHLYYKILHDRHAFARHVRRKIQLLSEEKRLRMRISFSSKIYNVLPNRLQWMCRKFTVCTCMICDSTSYRKTVTCAEKTCCAHYCFECHVDAGQNCLTCNVPAPPPSSKTNSVPAPRSSFCV